jgi:nitroimidazol reductase NimA-like FMN-containing flavoprotein (pyridoxamine 5'-phosphate oxidase superfamily)
VVSVIATEPMDRRGLRVLPYDECLILLRHAGTGRLGFVHHGEPEVLPVNFGLDHDVPVFRTTWGSKLDAASAGHPVALEVDAVDRATSRAWSVVVKGPATVEYVQDAIARYELLGIERWVRDDAESFWIRVTPETVTGRELQVP